MSDQKQQAVSSIRDAYHDGNSWQPGIFWFFKPGEFAWPRDRDKIQAQITDVDAVFVSLAGEEDDFTKCRLVRSE